MSYRSKTVEFTRCNHQKPEKKKPKKHTPAKEVHLRLTTHLSAKEIRHRMKRKPNTLKRIWLRTKDLLNIVTSKIPQWIAKGVRTFKIPTDKDALPKFNEFTHEIPLKDGTAPKFMPVYACTQEELEALREYIEENLRRGYIRPSRSPAGHPILFVPKKNGKLRICVDYRSLNDITIKDRNSLPRIDESLDQLQGAKIFTKLDIVAAYHNLRIAPKDVWKTAFRTRYGLFEYLVMPFGLTNAPASFQTFMNHVLKDYIDKICIVYLDDILIYSKNPEEHRDHVNMILRALDKWDLKVELEKTEFEVTQCEFLGAIVTTNGIKMDPKKVEAIQNWPVPQTVKEIQAFLGLCNYYRRFIKQYSHLATALTELTKIETPFDMTPERLKSFRTLKESFLTAPILKLYDPKLPIKVETDASDAALGACLCQLHPDNEWHPVAYLSHKFTSTELRYPIHDKELMAVVQACKQWRVYLQTNETFTVYSDHKNLTFFMTTKELNRRQVRWWETLSEYNMKIAHFKGKDNSGADAISRRPDLMKGIQPDKGAILTREGKTLTVNKNLNLTTHTLKNEFTEELKKSYQEHPIAKRILNDDPNRPEKFSVQDGIILFDELFYVPTKKLQQQLIRQHHDTLAHGHLGIDRTQELITKTYFWPQMRQQIEQYIKTCDPCCRNKPNRHLPYGKLQPHDAPSAPFQVISYDFIQGLPPSRDSLTNTIYDEILVITCKFTKVAIIEPWNSKWSTKELEQVYNRRVFSQYGIQTKHICDRDRLFSSKYWNSIRNQTGTKLNIASKSHAQTDGATERLIQTIEIWLRNFLNMAQNNWNNLLPHAEFTYNTSRHSTTKYTPYEALRGWNPLAVLPPIPPKNQVPEAEKHVKQMRELHENLQKDLEFAMERMAHYYNKKRSNAPLLKEGDKAYLLARNIKRKGRPSKKLDYQKFGPYKITKKFSNNTFELEIPGPTRIHRSFHVSLLEPIPDGLRETSEDEEIEIEDHTEYEFERILEGPNNKNEYLIRWSPPYGPQDDSWEPEDNIPPEVIQAYLNYKPTAQSTTRKRGRPRKNPIAT
jgi:hypothetical protein